MSTFKQVIQLELNEISLGIVKDLCSQNLLPNFQKVLNDWDYRETVGEQEYELTEPWIQWVTAHTGKDFNEHQVFRLGDASNLKHEQIWETLSKNSVNCCIISSMNSRRGAMVGGIFLPDPWGKLEDVYPASWQSLWQFISANVKKHHHKISLFKYLNVLLNIIMMRLPFGFLVKLASQILRQKIDQSVRWKLPAFFDLFLFNVFKKQLNKPYAYYSLFLNSVAHYQHHYWRNFDRNLFNKNIQCPNIKKDDDPVRYGYKVYDNIVGELLTVANEETLILIVSGLTQEPYTTYEETGGHCYYRLVDHSSFLESLDIDFEKVKPLMSRDWVIDFKNEDDKNHYSLVLENLRVRNTPLFLVKNRTSNSVFIETRFNKVSSQDDVIEDIARQRTFRFDKYFDLTAIKSGHHNNKGVLFSSAKIFSNESETSIPLRDLYDLTLNSFGIRVKKEVSA